MRDEIIDHTGPLPPLAPTGRLPMVYLLIHQKHVSGISDEYVNEAMKEAGITHSKTEALRQPFLGLRLWREGVIWNRLDFIKAIMRYKVINNMMGGDL
jgi:hypothetical protein